MVKEIFYEWKVTIHRSFRKFLHIFFNKWKGKVFEKKKVKKGATID